MKHRRPLRVTDFTRQPSGLDPDFPERPIVLYSGIEAEDQIRVRRTMQPAVIVDFGLELARRPPGVAERQDRAGRSCAPRDRLEDVDGGREANPIIDRERRILDKEIRGMQHKTAPGLHRSTLEYHHL